jgi:hypothetical protein
MKEEYQWEARHRVFMSARICCFLPDVSKECSVSISKGQEVVEEYQTRGGSGRYVRYVSVR